MLEGLKMVRMLDMDNEHFEQSCSAEEPLYGEEKKKG